MNVTIRPERSDDIAAIDAVTAAAFTASTYGLHNEVAIINALRAADALTVSLVAQKADAVVGHIAVSPVSISDGSIDWYGLGPVSVLPDEQSAGVGSLLIDEALTNLRAKGAAGCVLLGEPAFYQRFGFRHDPTLTYPGVPGPYFQRLSFGQSNPVGTVDYHPAFTSDE